MHGQGWAEEKSLGQLGVAFGRTADRPDPFSLAVLDVVSSQYVVGIALVPLPPTRTIDRQLAVVGTVEILQDVDVFSVAAERRVRVVNPGLLLQSIVFQLRVRVAHRPLVTPSNIRTIRLDHPDQFPRTEIDGSQSPRPAHQHQVVHGQRLERGQGRDQIIGKLLVRSCK